MDFINIINKFYYEFSIYELKLMSKDTNYSKISHSTILYLNIIYFKENCTVSMLSDILNVTKSAVTIKVNELVRKGYLKKIQSQNDKRIYYLKLSDDMNDIFLKYDNVFYDVYLKLQKKYTKDQIENFCEIMSYISENSTEDMQNETECIR